MNYLDSATFILPVPSVLPQLCNTSELQSFIVALARAYPRDSEILGYKLVWLVAHMGTVLRATTYDTQISEAPVVFFWCSRLSIGVCGEHYQAIWELRVLYC